MPVRRKTGGRRDASKRKVTKAREEIERMRRAMHVLPGLRQEIDDLQHTIAVVEANEEEPAAAAAAAGPRGARAEFVHAGFAELAGRAGPGPEFEADFGPLVEGPAGGWWVDPRQCPICLDTLTEGDVTTTLCCDKEVHRRADTVVRRRRVVPAVPRRALPARARARASACPCRRR